MSATEVIERLMRHIFKIKRIFEAIFAVVSVVTLLAVVLVMALSWRLRQAEIRPYSRLGCSRRKIAELVATGRHSGHLDSKITIFINLLYINSLNESVISINFKQSWHTRRGFAKKLGNYHRFCHCLYKIVSIDA